MLIEVGKLSRNEFEPSAWGRDALPIATMLSEPSSSRTKDELEGESCETNASIHCEEEVVN